jgi:hypothetical protein
VLSRQPGILGYLDRSAKTSIPVTKPFFVERVGRMSETGKGRFQLPG